MCSFVCMCVCVCICVYMCVSGCVCVGVCVLGEGSGEFESNRVRNVCVRGDILWDGVGGRGVGVRGGERSIERNRLMNRIVIGLFIGV